MAGWLLTFDDIKVDVADEELVPLVGVTTGLVHPVLHLELHQPARQVKQRDRDQVRLPFN